MCTLYPGIECRDHTRAAVDIGNPRDDELVQVPFVELCPNTWLVLPTGEVERVAEKDQFRPKAIQKQAEALQKKLGEPLSEAVVAKVRPLLEAATKAAENMAWRETLEALAKLEEPVPDPHQALADIVADLLGEVHEMVDFEAEDILALEQPTAEQRAEAEKLLEQVDVEVYGRYVPVRDALKAWLAEHGACPADGGR